LCSNLVNDCGEVFAKDGDYAAFEKVMAEVLDLGADAASGAGA